ncbi:hypothetical protein JT359_05415 [Candidatus Poribacteria bacterium]|nr:hypothetical protein [Candidatus Poribacteria bacterium]
MIRKKKILLTLSISLFLLVLLGFLFLRSSYFLDNFLKNPIVRAIEAQIDPKYTVYIDQISGNIFTGVKAKEFSIREKDSDVPAVLTTTDIVLNYKFFSLLRRKLIISGLEINSPEFNIRRNSEGQLNLTQVLRESSQESDSSFNVDILDIIVKEGKINYIDESHNTYFNLPDITIKVDGKEQNTGYSGSLLFGKGSISIDGKELAVDTLGKTIQFNLSNTEAILQEHHLKFGNSDLKLSGHWNDNDWKLDAELDFDATDIKKFLIDDFQVNGKGKISLKANGTNTTLNGSLIVESPKLVVKQTFDQDDPLKSDIEQMDFSNILVNTSLEFGEESKIKLNVLKLQIAEGDVSCIGNITFDNSSEENIIKKIQHFIKNPMSYSSELDISEVQLKQLIPMLVVIPPTAAQINSGSISGSATITGTTNNSDIDFNGKLELVDVSLQTRTKIIQLEDSYLNCTIKPESEGFLSLMVDGNIDRSDVDIDGNLKTPTIVLSNVDFGKLCEIGNTLPLKGIGTITAQINEDKTATGQIEIPNLFFDIDLIPMGRLAGDYRYQNGSVYFDNAYLTKNGVDGDTKIAIEGDVKLEGKLPVNMKIIAEKLVLDEDYNRILFKSKYPVIGIISGELNLYNSLTHLDGKGEFSVESGVAWEVKLDPLQFQLDINDTSLTIQDFHITSRGQLVILNTHVTKTGDFDFYLKNIKDRPINMSEIAIAAGIDDFPFDGMMDVNVTSFYKKPDSSTEVSLRISDLAFNNNPLGDGYVDGKLIEPAEESTEQGYFKFIGKAFEDTTTIEGTVGISGDNPYDFTAKSNQIAATPFLRIFHPVLESVTGTADSTVSINGTIAELASTNQNDANRRVYPYDVDIVINNTELQYNSLHFSNPAPIHIEIVDDIITFSDSTLAVGQSHEPFLQIAGTIDAKTEEIKILSSHNQNLTLNAFMNELNLPIFGTAIYDLKLTGTLTNPTVGVSWQIPSLDWNTEFGDIRISDANGMISFNNNILHIQPFSLELLNNIIEVNGDIAINQENINKSQLNLNVAGVETELVNFSDIVKNLLPDEVLKRLTVRDTPFLNGKANIQLNINGSITEPIVDLRTHTVADYPIYVGTFEKPIKMDDMHAVVTIGSEFVDIDDLVVKCQIGEGKVHVDGKTSFSRVNNKEINYTLGVSTEKLEIGDFLKEFNVDSSVLNGKVSGSAKITGNGFHYDEVSVASKINEIAFNIPKIQIINITPIEFTLADSVITTFIPLKLTSHILDSQVDISISGPFLTPMIGVNWQGSLINLLHKESNQPIKWNGTIQYLEKQISILSELTNNGSSLKLNGLIPFNLDLQEVPIRERFIDLPLNVQLVGNELPLTFFPGIDTIFTEADGVADINLSLNGTVLTPHLKGNVFIEANKIQAKQLHHTFEKVRFQINAKEDLIELLQCNFQIGDGTFDLGNCDLQLDGLLPKHLIVEGVSLTKYPLGTVFQTILPDDFFKDVYGELTASVSKMKIPFDSFFEQGDEFPLPKLVRNVNYDSITREAEAEFTVDKILFGFIYFDQQFEFRNPENIPFTFNSGSFRLKGLRLENAIGVNPDEVSDPLVLSCFGRLDLRGEIFANLKISNLNISSLISFLPTEISRLYEMNGMLTTTISITGEYAAPNILIRLGGDKLVINQAGIDEFSGEFRYDSLNQEWTIVEEKTQILIGKNRLFCSGVVPFTISLLESKVEPSSDPIDLRINMIMDELGILPLVEPRVQSAVGDGNITASVTGSLYAPKINGHGVFSIDSLSIARSPIYIEDLESTFEFTEEGFSLEEMKGQLNNGAFTANGEIITDWFELKSVDVRGNIKNSVFTEAEKYQIELSSDDLHLSGMIDDTELKGNIRIHSGQYQQNWNWEDLLDSFSAGTVTDTDLLFYAPFIRNLTLDLGIDVPNNFHLISSTGGQTDIEIKCRGQLTGAIQAPIFTGDLSILRGKLSVITQIFEIQEGSTIRNLSDKSFDPELDIILQTLNPIRGVVLSDGNIADFMITITVTGKLDNANIDNAKVSLGAEPINSSTTVILSDADVLALLSPGNSISRSFAGITFTISSGFDPNQRHIIGEYPLPFGNNMSIRMEGDEKGEFGVDLQLLERRF